MIVKELIKELQQQEQDAEVSITTDAIDDKLALVIFDNENDIDNQTLIKL